MNLKNTNAQEKNKINSESNKDNKNTNTLGMCGIDFIEFSSVDPLALEKLFFAFGFSKTHQNKEKTKDYFNQNDIHFFVNKAKTGAAFEFSEKHGPSICSMGWRFENPKSAYDQVIKNGAKTAQGDFSYTNGNQVLAIEGIGGMLIYFMDSKTNLNKYSDLGFQKLEHPENVSQKGFLSIDHLTNNVAKGTMQEWANFYKNIFGFTEVRYFDIRGTHTGLTSYALKSPCGQFCIPINEAAENKSQINEYLEEYKGPGVQHLAFLTEDILQSLDLLSNSQIKTLDIDNEYYKDIFTKFPQVTEDQEKIKKHNVLVDGDDEGYLLQIFTKNLIGPIFIEIIQRKNHFSFGEGNFGALFRSIERDQIKRGYL